MDSTSRPSDNATRGDAAAVISRFLVAVADAENTPPVGEEIQRLRIARLLFNQMAALQS